MRRKRDNMRGGVWTQVLRAEYCGESWAMPLPFLQRGSVETKNEDMGYFRSRQAKEGSNF